MSLSPQETELELARLAAGLELAERAARRLGLAPGLAQSGAVAFKLAGLAISTPTVRRLVLEEKGLEGPARPTLEEMLRIRAALDRVR